MIRPELLRSFSINYRVASKNKIPRRKTIYPYPFSIRIYSLRTMTHGVLGRRSMEGIGGDFFGSKVPPFPWRFRWLIQHLNGIKGK
jgi:hypothetical protein